MHIFDEYVNTLVDPVIVGGDVFRHCSSQLPAIAGGSVVVVVPEVPEHEPTPDKKQSWSEGHVPVVPEIG